MRTISLAKGGLNKVRGHQKELRLSDVEDSLKSLPPGEWCVVQHPSLTQSYLGFINPLVEEKFTSIHLVDVIEAKTFLKVEDYITDKLKAAYAKRQRYSGYKEGARIFYGASDGLPGLIIDQFQDKAIVQINTAGVDRYRHLIQETVSGLIEGKAYFLDNAAYREKEFLPTYENEALPEITIIENGLRYKLRPEVMQKIGFYYDHRENRWQLTQLMARLNQKFEKALDLFCYAGAWGMNALKAGVQSATFVDQGDFSIEINTALELNNFKGKGQFLRQDVFKFLDEAIKNNEQYDLILCDPPAFAKNPLQKNQALEGYSKLHRKVLKIAKPGALIAFSSCTHYVSHEEFQKNIQDASYKENRQLQLVHCGIQGWDHPISSLTERSCYIKSYFYLME